jgi:hypothetical protein
VVAILQAFTYKQKKKIFTETDGCAGTEIIYFGWPISGRLLGVQCSFLPNISRVDIFVRLLLEVELL